MVNILCIGDIVGTVGCDFLRRTLPAFKRLKGIDVVIANGENSVDGNGISPSSAKHILDSGVDVITTGNHSYKRWDSLSVYDDCEPLVRPANFPEGNPGKGVYVIDMGRFQLAVINLIGTVYMESFKSPFETLDGILKTEGLPKLCVVDLHAEATGEKKALGYYADGRVTAVFGTHTHVQTADETVLPKGTGYITDVGMTGPIDSILGVKKENIIRKLTTKMPTRFDVAKGDCHMDCILFTADEKTGLCTAVERISLT